MIVDSNFNKWNINKLKRDGSNLSESSEGTTVVTSFNNSNNADMNSGGIEGHYLWGQYFDATKDVAGDIDIDGDVDYSGNIIYKGDQGTNLTGNVVGNQGVFKNVASDTIENSGQINTDGIQGSQGIFNYGNINHLTSQDINVNNLTVTGAAHFFELKIDEIKAAGGSIILSPADGFIIDYIDGTLSNNQIRLYWRAEDGEHAVTNKWVVGDMALIQDFNKATVGTSFNVDNTYFWSVVIDVSSTPVDYNGEKCHYITMFKSNPAPNAYYVAPNSNASSIYVGASCAQLGHRKQQNETAAQAAERQTAIYMCSYSPSSGAYDSDLLAPYIIYYEGIGSHGGSDASDFVLSNFKKQWWSSGTRTAGVPANQMRGNFVLTSGTTVDEYIENYVDESLDDRLVSNCEVLYGSNNWFLKTRPDYTFDVTNQSWSTECTFRYNGIPWNVDLTNANTGAYLLNINGSTTTETALPSNAYSIYNSSDYGNPDSSCDKANITINQNAFPYWYGTDDQYVRIKFYSNDGQSNLIEFTFDVQCVKVPAGENGSATAVSMTEYFLNPTREQAIVYINGQGQRILSFDARYYLKKIDTDTQGNTIITNAATIPTGYGITYDDPNGVHQGTAGTISGTSFIAQTPNYYGTNVEYPLTNGISYVTVYLHDNNNNIIDRRTISVIFQVASSFTLKEEAITAAVQGAQGYTDNEISSVTNRISQLEVNQSGIQGTVAGLQTTVNNQGELINQKTDQSQFNQFATGIQTTVSQMQTDLSDKVSTSTFNSTITQTASQITANVTSNINGELSQTGIDITNHEINITADKFTVLDNNDNVLIGAQGTEFITNNATMKNAKVEGKLSFKDTESACLYAEHNSQNNNDILYVGLQGSQSPFNFQGGPTYRNGTLGYTGIFNVGNYNDPQYNNSQVMVWENGLTIYGKKTNGSSINSVTIYVDPTTGDPMISTTVNGTVKSKKIASLL